MRLFRLRLISDLGARYKVQGFGFALGFLFWGIPLKALLKLYKAKPLLKGPRDLQARLYARSQG